MDHAPLTPLVRAATRKDLAAILDIYNASIPGGMSTADLQPQTLSAREAWWDNRDQSTRPVLVACRGEEVIAWGAFTNFKDRTAYQPTAEISVYVAPHAAGMGLGRLMLDSLLVKTRECGIDRVLAICFAHNQASLRLFASRGFQEWGRLPDACDMHGVRRTVVMLGWQY